MRLVRYSDGAKKDVREIGRWYEKKRTGHGRAFRNELKRLLVRLDANPMHWAEDERYPGVRVCEMDLFPYLVYYSVTEEEVAILAVIHSSRDSDSFIDRFN